MMRRPNPFQKPNGWWFCDENGEEYGPYETRDGAAIALSYYALHFFPMATRQGDVVFTGNISTPPSNWKHIKSGGIYRIVDIDFLIEATMKRGIIYQSVETGQKWMRPYAEFHDGRFEEVKE